MRDQDRSGTELEPLVRGNSSPTADTTSEEPSRVHFRFERLMELDVKVKVVECKKLFHKARRFVQRLKIFRGRKMKIGQRDRWLRRFFASHLNEDGQTEK